MRRLSTSLSVARFMPLNSSVSPMPSTDFQKKNFSDTSCSLADMAMKSA